MKVVFFGDSLTWGGYGGDYVGAIRKHVGDKHEIINAGVGGNTVVNLVRRLGEDVLAHEPDKVFIMIGGNDAMSYSQPDTRPYYRKSQAIPNGYVSPDMFRREYRHLLSELQVNYIHTTIGLPPLEANLTVVDAMRTYNALAREQAAAHNIPVLDLFTPFVPEFIPERPLVSLRSIQQVGVNLQSGWSAWEQAQREGGYTYTFDGVHWTPATAEKVAAHVIDFMGL